MKDCISKYIGIPYLRGGSSFDGCDCWGLVRLFYHTELGIRLPDYKDFACGKELFQQKAQPDICDVALIAHNGVTLDHCAILTSEGLLHSLENTGALLSRASLWDAKIASWHSYKKSIS